MAKYLTLALTNPVEGREDEYNDWYDNVAIPTYRSIQGLTPLGRYKVVDVPKQYPFQVDNQWKYLSIYEFETDDLEKFSTLVHQAIVANPNYSFSDAIDRTNFFEPLFIKL